MRVMKRPTIVLAMIEGNIKISNGIGGCPSILYARGNKTAQCIIMKNSEYLTGLEAFFILS